MFSIHDIPKPHNIKIYGKIGKIYQTLIKEIINVTLFKERIKETKIIEVIISTQIKMKEYHKKFLNDNTPTDIISIEYSKNKTDTMLGTIILCPIIIKNDCQALQKDYTKHLTHLLIHGTLHLLGYSHKEDNQQKQMETKEINILSFLGIESPYHN